MRGEDHTNSVFYAMTNGAIVRQYNVVMNHYETEAKIAYEMLLPGYRENEELSTPFPFYPEQYTDNCLSCDLAFIASSIEKSAGRYILPLENIVILIDGEDFDGEEASRIAAGGFLVLEVVQAGKIYKFVKGAKIFSKTGQSK